MNPTAVITYDQTNKKSYVWEPACLYPKVSILDPELTLTLPAYRTACGTQGFTPMHQPGHVLSSHFGATHGATLASIPPINAKDAYEIYKISLTGI